MVNKKLTLILRQQLCSNQSSQCKQMKKVNRVSGDLRAEYNSLHHWFVNPQCFFRTTLFNLAPLNLSVGLNGQKPSLSLQVMITFNAEGHLRFDDIR